MVAITPQYPTTSSQSPGTSPGRVPSPPPPGSVPFPGTVPLPPGIVPFVHGGSNGILHLHLRVTWNKDAVRGARAPERAEEGWWGKGKCGWADGCWDADGQ